MKIKNSLKRALDRHPLNYIAVRKRRVYIRNKLHKKYKLRQG